MEEVSTQFKVTVARKTSRKVMFFSNAQQRNMPQIPILQGVSNNKLQHTDPTLQRFLPRWLTQCF